jgi:glycosyltransferase involved in cell wall biosynthesis
VNTWHIITSEYPPDVGGVSDYTQLVADALAHAGDAVHVWCPGTEAVTPRPLPMPTEPASRVEAHRDLGRIRPADLRQVDVQLDAWPGPRRLLVQWVPHGYGYHSMNLWFCLWLAKRARWGDRVELMVHEPYLAFERGPLRHVAMAAVHRLMTVVLLGAASRVWVSIPTWEARLRPYALGRRVAMTWLPIPACLLADERDIAGAMAGATAGEGRVARAGPDADDAVAGRLTPVDNECPLVGHFGTYGPAVATLLEARLPAIMDARERPSMLLLGAGSDAFRRRIAAERPEWADRIQATGHVSAAQLREHIAGCDLFVQPYPDGVSSRRTTAMACLSEGRPVVTTRGHLTEPLWEDTHAVWLADVVDGAGFDAHVSRLLGDAHARRVLGARGLEVYDERFAVRHVVAALRSAPRAA